ncbi:MULTISPECIES: hypothetical protein [Flavobacteriaceae]|jgi:hypothetical protein|uniref:Uncharacterized protein n=2 Tax=Flavobacteriaceae TaxID=49546 RepID=A0ABP3UW61_9FLAO|nr:MULTISPECIES: hypothetical protein [Flavobacteriaceae]RYH74018.1 hypothetical protein EVU94_08480 [Flavobacteriaceae bacterium 144Ye]TBV25978.1 hypothetical protein DMZ43_08715 [Meridianimaribacter sp. CL38]TDY11352.1 hypothetical protein A8975_1989 [Meridianimaribacter flavus]
MKKVENEIYNHDTDVDLTHKINSVELDNWIAHLEYIKKELANLVSICTHNMDDKINNINVLAHFKKKQKENDTLLNALVKYSVSRSHIVECEDTQCDMVYITEHESYRRSYLYHLDKYRRLKDDFFKKVKGKFALLKMT